MSLFGLCGETRDGICVLIGGFCRSGWERRLEELFTGELRTAVFSPCADPFLTDVKLHRLVTAAAEHCRTALEEGGVRLLAAAVPGGEEPCGAVMGPPFSQPESAGGELESAGEGLYFACWPGALGAAFMAPDAGSAQTLYRKLRGRSLEQAADTLEHTEFLLVSDGGAGRQGRLMLGNGRQVRCLTLPPSEHRRRNGP